jgi:hypothetical protein
MADHPKAPKVKLLGLVLTLGWLTLPVSPALAAPSWTEVGTFASGLSYVDLDSATHQKNLTQVVTMLSYDSPQVYSSKKTYQSTRTIMEFDCAKHLVHAQSVVFYSGPLLSGNTISKEGVISSLEPVPRGTPIEKIMHQVCD